VSSLSLNAVHKACYYELDTECLKALLETGFDACADDPSAPVPSPMLMTLNQGVRLAFLNQLVRLVVL
jgi:hypothetical protein